MVQAGKARVFEDENPTELRIKQEELYSLGSRKNDSSTGAVQFGGQSGFVPPAQSGLQDTSKVAINGSQMEGVLGFTLRIAKLDVGTGILDIARNFAGNLFNVAPGDLTVALSAGFTSNLEFIQFAKFEGHRLRLYGIVGNTITVIHTGIGTFNAIKCPTDVNFVWVDDEIIDFVFNVVTGQWHLMTGVGPSGGGGAFANQTLSNLTPNLVRVNTDLEPDTTATHSLGTTPLRWLDLWLSGVAFIGSFDSTGIGGVGGDFNANFWDIDAIAVPANPPGGTRRVFVDTTNNDELSIIRSDSTVVSLEAGAGAGFANQSLSNLNNPTSINESLIPQGVGTKDLGTSANPWGRLYLGDMRFATIGTKSPTEHQIFRDSPNNNMIFNVPLNEQFTWCENGIPNMNLEFGRLALVSLSAGVERTGANGTFDQFINSTSPGLVNSSLGLIRYEGFDDIPQQTTFASTVADLISPIAGQEIGAYQIKTIAQGVDNGLTYEQNDDTFSLSHFGIANQVLFFELVHDPIAVNAGTLDIVQRFRGQNSAGALQDMVRFEMLFQDRTPGSEDVKFDIQVQRDSAVQSFMDFNDSGNNKIRSRKNFNLDDNLLELNTAGDVTISSTASAIDYNFPTGLEYFMSSGVFFIGDAGPTGAFMQVRDLSLPGTPVSGRGRIFLDSSDNILKIVHDDSTVKSLEASGTGSQTPWLSNINANNFTLFNIPNIDLVDTGGFGDGRITFDSAEDSDTWIGNDNVVDQVRFVANAVVQARFNPDGWIFSSKINMGSNRIEFVAITPASVPTPPIGQRNLFSDGTTGSPIGQLSVKTSDGTTISLEQGGAGGGADTDLNNLVGTAVNQALVPDVDNLRDLGSSSREWRNLFVDGTGNIDSVVTSNISTSSLNVSGTANFNGGTVNINSGTINIGNSSSDNIKMNGRIDTSMIPDNDNSFDIGSSSLQWRNAWFDGIVNADGLDIGGVSDFNNNAINNVGNLEIDGDLNHDGSRIGFFGRTPQTKNTVPFATFSLISVVIAFNTMRGALLDYGLIQ